MSTLARLLEAFHFKYECTQVDDESNSCDLKLVNLCLQKHSACISENVSSEGVYVVGGSIEGFGWRDDVDLFKDFSLEDKDLSEETKKEYDLRQAKQDAVFVW